MELTREIVLAEPPGKRLDSWIAEKVMGWEYKDAIYSWGEVLRPSQWIKPNGWPVDRVSCYSTDTAAVWEVAEQLQKQGYVVCIELLPYEETSVGVYEADPANQIAYAKAQTPAEAICKAALLAVMEG